MSEERSQAVPATLELARPITRARHLAMVPPAIAVSIGVFLGAILGPFDAAGLAAAFTLLVLLPIGICLGGRYHDAYINARLRATRSLLCPRCHYPLDELPSKGTCPECGRPFDHPSVREIWDRTLGLEGKWLPERESER